MDHASRGAEAIRAGNYPAAITCYTLAIEASPTSPDYYTKRSTAHQRSSPPDFAAALSDAEIAVILAQKRAKRELILQAQLRRGIALFGQERYADAAFVFAIVKRIDPSEKILGIWEEKIKTKLSSMEEGDPRAKVTAKETPEIDTSKPVVKEDKTKAQETAPATSNPVQSQPAQVAQTPANKIRHEWYQNTDNVYVTLFVKGVPKDKVVIEIHERLLSISFPLLDSTYEFTLDPLFAPIDDSKSPFSIFSTKIEVVLKKLQPGQKWPALEGSEPVTIPDDETIAAARLGLEASKSTHLSGAPSYPTSSRSGPKNWDKLAADLTAKKPKKEAESPSKSGDKAAKVEDDDDYDYDVEPGDEANAFFKKLYAGSSPDVQKAMMKSFTESGGTALSTNWEEVSKAKVEVQPPNGMEAKKWE